MNAAANPEPNAFNRENANGRAEGATVWGQAWCQLPGAPAFLMVPEPGGALPNTALLGGARQRASCAQFPSRPVRELGLLYLSLKRLLSARSRARWQCLTNFLLLPPLGAS